MFTNKRVKLVQDGEDSSDGSQISRSSAAIEDTNQVGEESSQDTDDEVTNAQRMRSKKTLKRKRRATEPLHFGETLRLLLNTDAPSGLPLSLKPSVAHQKNDAKLESEAKRVTQIERKEKEEKGRIRDVIEGWGGESERSLRKVAQRGVVKLFNAIQQSQLAGSLAEEEAKATRGAGRPSLFTPSLSRKDKGRKINHKHTTSGREKCGATDKDDFFDMIRSGGIVSKA